MTFDSRMVSRILAGTLAAAMLAGCGEGGETPTDAEGETPLVYATNHFNGKFSPFFSETAYDTDVYSMTQISLLTSDRQGAIIYNGIEGETISYNGTDYTYYGPADLTITENADGTVDYTFKLRDDIVFSDGEKLTADDVIFSMYVLSDPTYDGSSTFFALPIVGMEEYRSGMTSLANLLIAAGKDNTDFTLWDEETQTKFWEELEPAADQFVQEICDYLIALEYNTEEDDISSKMANWGFEVPEGATNYEVFMIMLDAYGNDLAGMTSTEAASSAFSDLMPTLGEYAKGIKTGDSAANIAGITKISDTEVNVKLSEVDATAIYQLGVTIAPMHYYGEADKYDYDNNMFGFDKGDLSHVRSMTTKPMGAGPYKFLKFENGVVYFEANDTYFKGAPKTKYINFIESNDPEFVSAVVTGTADISMPSFSEDKVKEIKEANTDNGELTGSTLTTVTNDTLGYGYIGIGADQVNVGGVRDSAESKNLRKAFATIFSVYRNVAIDSYYGDRASVINYPISNTSWAAPQATDPDYAIAFSKKADGTEIYTSDMTADDRYEAAKAAALEYFAAAGCTIEDGKVVAAPAGVPVNKEGQIEYEVGIGGSGSGDHPSFMILKLAKDALAEMNVNLIVTDYSDWSEMQNKQKSRQMPMWCMAWQATVDPDMYQIYYSDVANGGANAGGSNASAYAIQDAELDQLILAARKSLDQSYRKTLYKAALDIVVDWAVEVPVYQRQDCTIFSTERVNIDTVTPDITTFYGWMAEIENIELN
ncbi:MAG: ABC transporter substrate-binding protein [Solobacterium sp.]|nr:ABC transporter substrate-binding protein [Solobacterium sp.]